MNVCEKYWEATLAAPLILTFTEYLHDNTGVGVRVALNFLSYLK